MKAACEKRYFEQQNFVGREGEFEKALEAFNNGNSLFLDGEENYLAAKIEYEKAYAFNPNNAMLNYNLGVCCLKSSDKFKAKPFFEKAFELHNTISNRIYFYFASCYQLESNWDSAIVNYNFYNAKAKLEPNSTEWNLVEKRKLECSIGRAMKKNAQHVSQ